MSYCRKILLLILLQLLCFNASYSQVKQDYVVTVSHISADNGMLTEAITCGLQDKLGFIWLGSADGLQRYDGAQFKLLTSENSGLQANHINHLALAASGLIWVSYGSAENKASGMVDLLNPTTGKVIAYRQAFGTAAPVPEREIFLVLANKEGDIFIITLGSDVWMYHARRFSKIYNHPAQLLLTRSTWHHKANGGQLWLSTADMGCVHVDTSGKWGYISYQKGSTATQPLAIYNDGSALLWVTYEIAGLYPTRPHFLLARPDDRTTPSLFDPYTNINGRYFQDYYLCGQWDVQTGGFVYQTRNPEIRLLLPGAHTSICIVDSASMASLNNALLGNVFSDASGRYWLCTARGVFIADVRPNKFRHFLDKTQLKITLNQTRGISETESGSTWAAMWDGVYEFSDNDGTINRRIPGRNPTVLYRDGEHTYAATRDSLIDLTGGAATSMLPGKLGFENEVWALRKDNDRFYAGTIHGIWNIAGPGTQWQKIPAQTDGCDGWCYGFFASRDKKIWATTTNGLLCIKNGIITDRYAEHTTDSIHYLPCTDIHYMYEDEAGDFWLCTNGKGLLHWQKKQTDLKNTQ